MRAHSLLKNFSWNVVGSFVYALSQWLLIVVLNHFGNLEMVGLFSLGLALGAPIMLFLNLKLRTIQSTHFGYKYNYNDFYSLRLLTNICFLFLIHIVAIFYLDNFIYSLTIVLVGYMKVIESIFDVGYGLFQRIERLDIVAKSYINRSILGTLSFAITLITFHNLIYSLISLCVVWVLAYFVYDIRKIKNINGRQKFTTKKSKEIFIIGLPLGIVALLGSLSLNFPRVVIENFISIEALGVFSSIVYLNLILGRFVLSMGQAIIPRLAHFYSNESQREYIKLFTAFLILIIFFSTMLVIISFFFGEKILVIIYGTNYIGYSFLLVLIMIYGLFYYLCVALQIGLDSIGSFKAQIPIVVINISLIIVFSLILIPLYGLEGAAYTLIFSSVAQLLIYIFIFVKKLSFNKI